MCMYMYMYMCMCMCMCMCICICICICIYIYIYCFFPFGVYERFKACQYQENLYIERKKGGNQNEGGNASRKKE